MSFTHRPARESAHAPDAPRRPRRDAAENRERLLATAAALMLRRGRNVPLAEIASEAGVGVATLYRSYADREALLHALEYRAYSRLREILEEVDRPGATGLDSLREYLERALDVADQLVLPLHGAPPIASEAAVEARRAIYRGLERFIARGETDGSIRVGVTATDVIFFSAMTTQPLANVPHWRRIARRQIGIFVAGLSAGAPGVLTERPVGLKALEAAFARKTRSPEGR